MGNNGLAEVQQRISQISNSVNGLRVPVPKGTKTANRLSETGTETTSSNFDKLLDEYRRNLASASLLETDEFGQGLGNGSESLDPYQYAGDNLSGLALSSRLRDGGQSAGGAVRNSQARTVDSTRSISSSTVANTTATNSSLSGSENVIPVADPTYVVSKWHHLTPQENHGMLRLNVSVVDEQGNPINGVKIKRQTSDGKHTDYATTGDKAPGVAEYSFETANHTGGNWTVSVDDGRSETAINLRTDLPDEGDGNTRNHHSYDIVFTRVGSAASSPNSPAQQGARTNPASGNPPALGRALQSGESQVVVQKFERGSMVWSNGKIVVISPDGSAKEYQDSFRDGMEEKAGLTPPKSTVQEPIRGFGKLWRDNPEFKETLGWAIEREFPTKGTTTTYENGKTIEVAGTKLTWAGNTLQVNAPSSAVSPPPTAVGSGNPNSGSVAPINSARPVTPTTPVAPSGRPMTLSEFPRPVGDNGRSIHWIPTTKQSPEIVDRFVREAVEMKMKWTVIVNEGTDTTDNDYLVKQLVKNGIMPIMRVYTHEGQQIQGDLKGMVQHYKALGVDYFQLYNEPNLNEENSGANPDIDKYLDKWIPAARAVTEAGGLPGFGALAPGGNMDDMEFLKIALDRIKARGETSVLDRAWLSMHNYTLNHPLDYAKDSNGFLKFKWYDQIVREKLGRSLPIIGTEGGTHVGSQNDGEFPAITEDKQVDMVLGAYNYMRNREPYNFAYSYWVIANEEGGGTEPKFSSQALFQPDRTSPLVAALKRLN